MLKLESVCYGYGKERPILRRVSFEIRCGEIVGIAGDSGCGKTTLCRLILGLLKPDEGEIFFEGEKVEKLRKRRKLHRSVQMVSQNPETAFDPSRSMKYSLREMRCFVGREERAELLERIERGRADFGLPEGSLKRRPEELSGGQLQRFSILRALLLRPKILILDEVMSMLDLPVQAAVLRLLLRMKEEGGFGYLMVSHDLELLLQAADRILFLEEGEVVHESLRGEYGKDRYLKERLLEQRLY
ncbi:MAG: ATP-binding cassette domain-containing protein [Peptostreptococcaceae bacterium]|nr:ATP-binding cassette domain-containing protein [Peptostreptococcaceae bacterium]